MTFKKYVLGFASVCALGGLVFASSMPLAEAANIFGGSPAESKTAIPAPRQGAPESFADEVEKLLPAVVNISSTQKAMKPQESMPDMPQFPPGSPFEDFFEDFMNKRGLESPELPMASMGSGFVIDAEKGLVVTNNHVVRDAEKVRVTFQDNESVDAVVMGTDEKTDLAILQIKTKKKLTAVKFGDSDVLRVGDWVLAIGNPFGLGGTVTAGVISARQRDIQAGPYDDFLQTDASVNRGNSGGPMFNLKGEVIGINTAIYSPTGGSVGIGFAIPSALAAPVVKQIVEFGRTRRGWLGVKIQSVTPEIAESIGFAQAGGALVASVTPKGPAQEAGLKTGDIILEFNGQKIDGMRKLPRLVAEASIGTDAKIKYWRGGKELMTSVKVAELEKAEQDGLIPSTEPQQDKGGGDAIPLAAIRVKLLNDMLRRDFNIGKDITGVVIVAVDPRSNAAESGLAEGDVIVEINQQPVETPAQVKEALESAKKGGRSSVLLLVSRDGDARFVPLNLETTQDKGKTGPGE